MTKAKAKSASPELNKTFRVTLRFPVLTTLREHAENVARAVAADATRKLKLSPVGALTWSVAEEPVDPKTGVIEIPSAEEIAKSSRMRLIRLCSSLGLYGADPLNPVDTWDTWELKFTLTKFAGWKIQKG